MRTEKRCRRWHVIDDDGADTGIVRKTRELAEQAVVELLSPPPEPIEEDIVDDDVAV